MRKVTARAASKAPRQSASRVLENNPVATEHTQVPSSLSVREGVCVCVCVRARVRPLRSQHTQVPDSLSLSVSVRA